MPDLTGRVNCLLVLSAALVCCPPAVAQSSASPAAPAAAIEGRITVVENINRVTTARPLRNLTVYLFTLDQSKPLLELQRRCRRSMARPGVSARNAFAAYNVCQKSLSDAADLAPRLASTASTKTDADGVYKFEGVLPARRYQVVSVKVEADEPSVITGLTPKLKANQRAKLDLSENDPWTNADPVVQ